MDGFPLLYILDFDGVLASDGGRLLPQATEALAEIRSRGGRIAVGSLSNSGFSMLHGVLPPALRATPLSKGGERGKNCGESPLSKDGKTDENVSASEALRRLGANPATTAVVSDTAEGIWWGHQARCLTIGATYGRENRQALIDAGADALFGDIGFLPLLRPALGARLRKELPARRFAHTLGVAEEALQMAVRFGANREAAWLAGMLHDCAKGIPTDRQAAVCDELGVPLEPEVRLCPSVIHGFLGEHLARTVYGVDDPAVLRAIRLHTVGDAGMSTLERIVFLADATEPNRDFPGVADIRAAADNNLDEGLRVYVAGQFRHLVERRVPMHPGLLRLWNDLVTNPPQP